MSASQNPTQALPTQGFKVELAVDTAGAPGAYGEIGQIPSADLTPAAGERKMYSFTTNSSPKGVEESINSGQRTRGEVTFNLLFNPTIGVQAALIGYYNDGTKCWLRITTPDGGWVAEDDGWMSKAAVSLPDNPQMLAVTFKPAGVEKLTTTFKPA